MEPIPLLDLKAQYQSIKEEIDSALQRVIQSGHFILGEEVAAFEREIAAYLGVEHAVGVASGTDALILALRVAEIGPGMEVIIPDYTFFATAGAVLHVGAKPVCVDIDPRTYCLDVERAAAAVTGKTKAIIPVHLYGHPAEMDGLLTLAKEMGLVVIEDNAQAFGAEYKGNKTGSMGDLGCLSFFPSKNLGAYGDGGMVVTNDVQLAERVRLLRTHGWKRKYYPEALGYNSRLDALQAAVLRVKLRHLDRWNDKRSQLASRYNARLQGAVVTPYEEPGVRHVYHLYVTRTSRRDELQEKLKASGNASEVYYPQPLHLAEPLRTLGYQADDFPQAERASRETLAIPLYPELTDEQVERIIKTLIEGW
jgi:dTDP-4-amino-4,6-dideoxygalactose transaminase